MFEGILPAIITPFHRDSGLSLDIEGLRSNIESLLQRGVHGIVPCGSTGESATLTFEEHEQVIGETVEVVNGRVPVLAGTGSNNTAEAVRLTRSAQDAGADGALIISPYYNKPNRSGLIKHFTKLADLDLPVILYNVPGRTGQNLQPDLVIELARHPNIVGIKEASGDITQISRIIEGTQDEDFILLSGDDAMTLPVLAVGGAGVISVAANVDPGRMVQMYEAFRAGNLARAQDLHHELAPLMRAMFIDTNPIPVKKAVELLGMAAGSVRLPLDELDSAKTEQLRGVLASYD
ncbi:MULTISPECIES: 4-hydroxy-tetrahydrodipicolinate synthase [unclassified Methanoculleus]|uniref:4-hydroxy-tetrahydrodipicolinate synthase n=1 Tax=unclassified Methanoculleus TaxID=2619537 RepID=UPI0025FFCCA0|nr:MULTISPECIES: 4-hydroxy-tetrahydrodipicolinate synthase [unclassified Methanoculleus]MCK9318833.1 4-hydroxy-tetrahydrodipicolinate synthase [Methanoculleus sp.]MDD2254893.1 4-hydroxy-tetrahydrodipicolinate synthase [Methanoculleus sp.]MDD2787714.1 4-hydroxy-tetrahydrodipicolinate synthase [Methanoculleus sp.]MDD3217070.1 4-hydroxy-tetrahydrodipicolinate synthase [Methanoculleus sp.]MDD4313624.1 4-hydroxy-tetrahydrodipicolinate synthase [Methanoculleus sp.]